ncbi:hypothetical protein MmiHf6_01210 [Methanimicrococcus hongohii]|uniref:Phosphoesterase n=1 Tax=Methanimicrococcus hongohii TaxID=3028295 RepID=A0AA96ZT70_9EURY|nr:metallophosphoesterase [Methanimicrococcus sp. Hf6]WNY22836.1 hypothetical protein MmiHf6_01210 [Methanimicrococcus sp. Hf6]
MKILALSDTHIPAFDSPEAAKLDKSDLKNFSFLSPILRHKIFEADLIVHAGDIESDDAYRIFLETGKLKAVRGNTDNDPLSSKLPEKLIFEEFGIKFGVVHEAGLSLDDNTARWYLLEEMDVDVLIYGHVHSPMIDEYKGKFLVCPGSPTRARLSEPTVAEIIIDEDKKEIEAIELVQVGQAACGAIKFYDELIGKSEKK